MQRCSWFAMCLSMSAAWAAVGCGGRGGGRGGAGGADACLPAEDGITFHLSTVGERPQLCLTAAGAGDDGRPRACWSVNLGTGDVRAADIAVVPGRGRRMPAAWTADGLCAGGYCIPSDRAGAEGGDDEVEPMVDLAVGAHVAVMIGRDERFYLFDETKKLLPVPEIGDREDGPSASPADPLIVDDVIFVGDFDAGPHADVQVYDAKGRFLGSITDPADEEEFSGDYELWNGSVSVISDHEVVFAEHLLERMLVFDTRQKKVTQVWERRIGKLPQDCTEEMRDIFFDPVEASLEFAREEGRMAAFCLSELERLDGRFGPLGVARGGEGGATGFVALAKDGFSWALVHFDGGGAVKKEVKLVRCGM